MFYIHHHFKPDLPSSKFWSCANWQIFRYWHEALEDNRISTPELELSFDLHAGQLQNKIFWPICVLLWMIRLFLSVAEYDWSSVKEAQQTRNRNDSKMNSWILRHDIRRYTITGHFRANFTISKRKLISNEEQQMDDTRLNGLTLLLYLLCNSSVRPVFDIQLPSWRRRSWISKSSYPS